MDKRIESGSNEVRRKRIILYVSGMVVLLLVVVSFLPNNTDAPKRPQEPSEPFPYHQEEVIFENANANITLAGTLTLPSKSGKHPVVILISGSGPQTRDYEFAGHKSFLVLADYLTRNGIAVLRYDDRGFGKSTGNFAAGTSLDFSFDVESAVRYLKTRDEVMPNKIGLIGHSDGAMVAPMVAARSKDVSFIVLLAGPGVKVEKLLLDRQELVERKMGRPEAEIAKSRNHSQRIMDIIKGSPDGESTKAALAKFVTEHIDEIPEYAIPPGLSKKKFIDMQLELFSSPFFRYVLTYDPSPVLQRVKCPVLALNGSLDVQVPAKENLAGIEHALLAGGNSDVVVHQVPGLNHAFQECITGMPDEYARISQTFSPAVMDEIRDWIGEQYR